MWPRCSPGPGEKVPGAPHSRTTGATAQPPGERTFAALLRKDFLRTFAHVFGDFFPQLFRSFVCVGVGVGRGGGGVSRLVPRQNGCLPYWLPGEEGRRPPSFYEPTFSCSFGKMLSIYFEVKIKN